MRRFLFDQTGEVAFYLTGAGVLYNVSNQPVGIVQREAGVAKELEPVTSATGAIVAWFDDAFLWTNEGALIAFVKGAKPQDDVELPEPKKLVFKPEPKVAPFKPLLARAKPPKRKWCWAEKVVVFESKEDYA